MNWDDYPNFSAQEFNCSHCGQNEMKPEFMAKLQSPAYSLWRTHEGHFWLPLPPTHHRGQESQPWRTRKRSGSRHRHTGVRCTQAPQNALEAGFAGIGVQQKGTGRFLHLDTLEGDLRPTVWSY
jgi:zinc D-Ala-D-Ala carboxypeptidase